MKPVIVDVTEFAINPIRTGIQRVVRELIRHWPSPGDLLLARFDPPHGLVPLSPAVLPLLLEADGDPRKASPEKLRDRVAQYLSGTATDLPADAVVLVPELFYEPRRCAWYTDLLQRRPDAARFIVYDFIPWLHPERLIPRSTALHMPYLRMIREASFTAFISGQTRADYALRIRRCASAEVGPVLPLGADGLSLEQQTFASGKRSYVVLGAINRYKNQDCVFAAFRHLWHEGFDGSLVMIGMVHDPTAEGWLREAGREPRFRHLANASDEEARAELRDARATVFVSTFEGFGLPPVESLHAGIPVIVTATTPSIADLPENGQIRLASVDVPAIIGAIRSMADEETAARLWKEAASLQLSTWREFAHRTAEWIHESRRDTFVPILAQNGFSRRSSHPARGSTSTAP